MNRPEDSVHFLENLNNPFMSGMFTLKSLKLGSCRDEVLARRANSDSASRFTQLVD
jgi:hypothetical protein